MVGRVALGNMSNNFCQLDNRSRVAGKAVAGVKKGLAVLKEEETKGGNLKPSSMRLVP